jgi:hypothetical protein
MKLRTALATAVLGAVALTGIAGCGPMDATAALSPDATALSALGFSTDDVVAGNTAPGTAPGTNALGNTAPGNTAPGTEAVPVSDPSPSGSAKAGAKHPRLRRLTIRRALAGNVEHGEVVVKAKSGDQTIDVQRGTVTAINSTSVTVKSADGFTLTWTFGNPIHVGEHRTSVQPSSVAVGETIGVAGTKSGGTMTARLMVIPPTK